MSYKPPPGYEDKYRQIIENNPQIQQSPAFSSNVALKRDPRLYPLGGMWRDILRRDLDFPSLGLDFHTIRVGEILKGDGSRYISMGIHATQQQNL